MIATRRIRQLPDPVLVELSELSRTNQGETEDDDVINEHQQSDQQSEEEVDELVR